MVCLKLEELKMPSEYGIMEMRKKGNAPNRISYTTLVHGLCKREKVDSAIFYFLEVKNYGYEPNTFIYLLLIDSLILNQNALEALELLKEVVKKGDFPNTGPKNLRLMRKVACNLYEDASTCLDLRIIVMHFIRSCKVMLMRVNKFGDLSNLLVCKSLQLNMHLRWTTNSAINTTLDNKPLFFIHILLTATIFPVNNFI